MNSVIVEASDDNLDDVIDFVMGELEAYDVDDSVQMQLELAIEEIFVNITSYAYENDVGEAEIRVDVKEDPVSVEITFMDQGVPFDPLEAEDADTSVEALEEREGGLGILMVKRCMDDVLYSYEDGKNILTIKKTI